MDEFESRCLDQFSVWVANLGEDVGRLARLIETHELSPAALEPLVLGLNYVLKSLDLITDDIADLGYLDDAFVLRQFALQARRLSDSEALLDSDGVITRLADDTGLIQEFLGEEYERLARFTQELDDVTVRGRSRRAIVEDEAKRSAFAAELGQWADAYQKPSVVRHPNTLIKLRSFLLTKVAQ